LGVFWNIVYVWSQNSIKWHFLMLLNPQFGRTHCIDGMMSMCD